MQQILELISGWTFNERVEGRRQNKISNDILFNEIKSKINEFSKGEGRELIEDFLTTMKNKWPTVCCYCYEKKDNFRLCNICKNMVCNSDINRLNQNQLMKHPILKKDYFYNGIVCPNCLKFFKNYLPSLNQFTTEIYPHYKYFILAHYHVSSYFSGISFLYHLITNGYIKNIVAHLEYFFEDIEYRNYTDNNIVKAEFTNQLSEFNNNENILNSTANILTQYTANEASYPYPVAEICALQLACKTNKIPLYTFDNAETSGGYPKDGWIKRRLKAHPVIAQRIITESSKHLNAKVFIPIGSEHVQCISPLQQYLPNSCVIQCRIGRGPIEKVVHSKIAKLKYKIPWTNIIELPFLSL
ncbi:MAG: hypothetical protein GY718_11885 [Lentisphaerae bacterium]|nr:hypothetical protein [Lentisphaerota bacterium]